MIGGSAGAFEPIYDFVSQLPGTFPIPVVIVLHRGKGFKSNLTHLLQSKAKLRIKEADEKEALVPGTVFLAPVDFHLLIEPDRSLSLDGSEAVLYSRPSIDVTFDSAADVYGKTLVSMIFSGANSDGTMGCERIDEKGGSVLIQHPDEADVQTMPVSVAERLKKPVFFTKADFQDIIHRLTETGKPINKTV